MRHGGGKRRRVAPKPFVVLCALVTGLLGLLVLAFRPLEDAPSTLVPFARASEFNGSSSDGGTSVEGVVAFQRVAEKGCKTVEEMGEDFGRGVGKESLRVRKIIENHFVANGSFCTLHTSFAFCSAKFLLF